MDTNYFTLKLYQRYDRILKKITGNNVSLYKSSLVHLDEYLNYLNSCQNTIISKIHSGASKKRNKNIYSKDYDSLRFLFEIKEDLSCFINVSYKISVPSTIKSDFLINLRDKSKKGYTYILKSDYGYKIGMTNDISRRFNEIRLLMPFDLSLCCYYELNRYEDFESFLHTVFKDKNINGEWFDLNDEDLLFIDKSSEKFNSKIFKL